jgi:hypothetical protein
MIENGRILARETAHFKASGILTPTTANCLRRSSHQASMPAIQSRKTLSNQKGAIRMSSTPRRKFIQSLAAAIAAPAVIRAAGLASKKVKRLPIAFSTLGCPNWEWKKILDQAALHGYAGNGIARHWGRDGLAQAGQRSGTCSWFPKSVVRFKSEFQDCAPTSLPVFAYEGYLAVRCRVVVVRWCEFFIGGLVQTVRTNGLASDVAVRGSNVVLAGGNPSGSEGVSSAAKRILVKANGREEVRFPAVSVKAGTARFQIAATSGKL